MHALSKKRFTLSADHVRKRPLKYDRLATDRAVQLQFLRHRRDPLPLRCQNFLPVAPHRPQLVINSSFCCTNSFIQQKYNYHYLTTHLPWQHTGPTRWRSRAHVDQSTSCVTSEITVICILHITNMDTESDRMPEFEKNSHDARQHRCCYLGNQCTLTCNKIIMHFERACAIFINSKFSNLVPRL